MDLQELAQSAQPIEGSHRFSYEGESFMVRLRRCSRGEVDRARRRFQTVSGRGRMAQPDFDWPRLRAWLVTRCICEWSDLTWRKALTLANLDPTTVSSNGAAPHLDDDVPCEPKNALWLLENAFGFEEFVWDTVLAVAGEREREEHEEKKT